MKTSEQKKQEKIEKRLSRNVAHLRRQGYQIDITHQFKGGTGHQALTDVLYMELPKSGSNKPVSGICNVTVTTPTGQISKGSSITCEPYNKKRGVQIALGRALKGIERNTACIPNVVIYQNNDEIEEQFRY